ncbi:MAG: hypothetical protein IKE57_03895 [Oscillospiraceae bacterium]|nr:hypothetical protein [Oscillospiraceae bacterium]
MEKIGTRGDPREGGRPCGGCVHRSLCDLCGWSCEDYNDWFDGWFPGRWEALRLSLGGERNG